jgi:23S rRNA pseudouridine2605 synthase
MPRRDDKHNAPPRGRDRPFRGDRRSAATEGNEKRPGRAFDKRGHAGRDKDKRQDFHGKREQRAFGRDDDFRKKGDRPRKRFDRSEREPDRDKPWRRRDDRHEERPRFGRPRWERNGDRKGDAGYRKSEPGDRKREFGDRKGDAGDRKGDAGDRKRDFGDRKREFGDRKRDAGDRKREFGDRKGDAGDRKRDFGDRKGDAGYRKSEPGYRGHYRGEREERGRPTGRMDWQEHPRSDKRFTKERNGNRKHEGEREPRIFARRPAFGGRGAYRQREDDRDTRNIRDDVKPKKSGERIAKVLARAGLASRRGSEEMVLQGRVTVNGRVINSPALDVTASDAIAVDGKPLPPRERTRLFLYHKPRGLMTTHADPEARPTVFDHLPDHLPRLISIGRLDFNTEGLLLLTNDGGLARELELPETGWLRRYRVRAHGEVTQAQLDELKRGIEIEGIKYGPIDATLERDQGSNVWLVFAIREGKNREVRNVLAHLGLEVNRLIRISYGPFQLGELTEGTVEEVRTRVLREQLGEKVIARAGADFTLAAPRDAAQRETPADREPFKPSGKSALVSDRKGRHVLVQRTGSKEARARNELEAGGYGPPRRPRRGYHGKRDFRPRDD